MNVGKGIEEDEVMDDTVGVEIFVVGFEILATRSGSVIATTTQATRSGSVIATITLATRSGKVRG